MGLGDMLGKAAGALGGQDAIMDKLGELGIDPAALADMDADAIKGMIEEKGIDLSMLDSLGLSLDDIIAKIKGA